MKETESATAAGVEAESEETSATKESTSEGTVVTSEDVASDAVVSLQIPDADTVAKLTKRLVSVLKKVDIVAFPLQDNRVPAVGVVLRTPISKLPVMATVAMAGGEHMLVINVPFTSTPSLTLEQAAVLNSELIMPAALIVAPDDGLSALRLGLVLGTGLNDRRDHKLIGRAVIGAFGIFQFLQERILQQLAITLEPVQVKIEANGEGNPAVTLQ